jgi:hypothetical protein
MNSANTAAKRFYEIFYFGRNENQPVPVVFLTSTCDISLSVAKGEKSKCILY